MGDFFQHWMQRVAKHVLPHKGLSLALLALLLAMPAAAQTHPCDAATPTSQTVTGGAPMYVLFCARPADNPTRADVTIDGGSVSGAANTLTAADAVTGPSATGYVQYKAVIGSLSKGTHTVTVTVYNLDADGKEQASLPSAPFAFGVVDPIPPPAAPKVTGVTK